jgi:hypothetical protein
MLKFGNARGTLPGLGVVAALAAVIEIGGPALAFDGWRVADSTVIEGKGAGWDYLAFDPKTNRLFIGHRKEGLQVFDTVTKKLIKVIGDTATQSSNGATLMPDLDLGVSNNENGTITPFTLSTLEAKPTIKISEDVDNSHYDPSTSRLVINVGSDNEWTDLVVLQAPSLEKVGVIRVPTKKPEHAEADGKGNFYLVARDVEKVFRLDTKALKVTAELPTPGCGGTNSIALDVPNNRIMLGCRGNAAFKPGFVVMDASTGKVVHASEIGGGNDGIIYDAELKRIFLSNGVHAVMHIFEQVDANTYKLLEAVGTQPGVRTMAIDPKTKKIYAATAEGSADMTKKISTSVSPWYANTFFPNTFKVLTYSKN